MAWGFVQAPASTNSVNTTTLTLAFGSNVATGNRIMVLSAGHSTVTPSIAEDPTISHTGTATVDSWTSLIGPITTNDGSLGRARIWTGKVTAGGSMSVVATRAGTDTGWGLGLAIAEYSGLSAAAGAAAMDTSASKTVAAGAGTGTDAYTSGNTGTTTGANELVFGGWMDDGYGSTVTAGTGFTRRDSGTGGEIPVKIEDKSSGASGATQAATWTTTNGAELNAVLCVVMKLAAAALAVAGSSGASSMVSGPVVFAQTFSLRGAV